MASQKIFFLFSVVFAIVIINIRDVVSKPPTKIVGGSNAEIEEFPSIVSIRYAKSHICGGALISKKHVLTAAHCLTSENKKTGKLIVTPLSIITVATGSKFSKQMKNVHKSKKFDIHEQYTGDMAENLHDIAIITLENEITEDQTQNVIALPNDNPKTGLKCFVVGWGSEREYGKANPLLQKAPMEIISNAQCQLRFNEKLSSGHLCAIHKHGVGFCDGDSGGPLFADGMLVGVVSMSIDCGKGFPDIYTRVYTYLNWIRERMH